MMGHKGSDGLGKARKKSRFFTGFRKGTNDFSSAIACIINSILLFIVYLIGVGFTSLFAKAVKKHFIERKIEKQKETYWSELNIKKRQMEEYYRQF